VDVEAEEKTVSLPPAVKKYIEKQKAIPGSLIKVLHKVQEHFSYIPRSAAFEVADIMEIPVAKVYGVITFYHAFKLEAPGQHTISVCMGTACYLKGGENLLEELKSMLGVDVGEITPDGVFSIHTVRCLGCCGLAPVMMIGDKVYGNVTKEKLPAILAEYQEN
jgi:NADH-quinone oxidoreductase subunit E